MKKTSTLTFHVLPAPFDTCATFWNHPRMAARQTRLVGPPYLSYAARWRFFTASSYCRHLDIWGTFVLHRRALCLASQTRARWSNNRLFVRFSARTANVYIIFMWLQMFFCLGKKDRVLTYGAQWCLVQKKKQSPLCSWALSYSFTRQWIYLARNNSVCVTQ